MVGVRSAERRPHREPVARSAPWDACRGPRYSPASLPVLRAHRRCTMRRPHPGRPIPRSSSSSRPHLRRPPGRQAFVVLSIAMASPCATCASRRAATRAMSRPRPARTRRRCDRPPSLLTAAAGQPDGACARNDRSLAQREPALRPQHPARANVRAGPWALLQAVRRPTGPPPRRVTGEVAGGSSAHAVCGRARWRNVS